jgi:PAS domain S-box-containing protein
MFDELKRRLGLDITAANLRVRAEQMNALIATRPSVIGVSMLLALLMAWLMWDMVDRSVLSIWLAALYLVHITGIVDLLRSPKRVATVVECRRWQRQLLRSYLLVGAIWGSAAIFLYIPDSLVQQAFLVCILIGMAAGGVAGNPTFLLAQQGYVVLVILPLMVSLLLQGGRDHQMLAVMVGVFLAFISKAGRDQYRNEEVSIRHRFENAELLENLKHANEQLALAQLAARAGIWEWDVARGRMTWTEELFLLFGLDPQRAPASLASWQSLIHPDDRERVGAEMEQAIREGMPLYSEYRIVLPDGQRRAIVAIGNSTRNGQGETVGMMGLCYDNTAQKAAQRRAHQAESRYHALIEQAGSALLVHDFDGKLLEVNHQACETLGYSREELLGMNLAEIDTGLHPQVDRALWEQFAVGHPVTFCAHHRRKDGSIFPAEVRLSSIVLDEQKAIIALITDISERLRFEEKLLRSEERYRTFAEKLPLGIAVLQDGLIKYANHATVGLIGYGMDELLDQPFARLIHEDDRPKLMELHRRRMQGEDVEGVFPVKMVRKDGEVRQWELHTSTTEWDGKRSSLAILTDITERVAMEEQMRLSLRQLEEKELAKTRFLAAAGHDLRQPVAAANLFVDALKSTGPSERQSMLINRLDQSMTVFSDLLERLLDISRLDAGLIKPEIVSFDLAELFGWLEQNFAGNAQARGLEFRIAFTLRRPLIVRTDIGLLRSVTMNLVGNAIKYTSRGGVMLTARLRGDRLLLQVWDTGCGIAEADREKIFDEFFQVSNPQRNREAGLGLGLSIGKRAMSLLGGEITCRSRVGRGSVFQILLPLDQEQQKVAHFDAGEDADLFASKHLFRDKRVAVLEDDSLVAEGLINLLQEQGAQVMHFMSAEEAMEWNDIHAVDYYLADYSLGGELTGADFLQLVQGRAAQPIKGVLVTGETSSHFIESIAGLPWPVLHKPVNYAKLALALKH